MKKELLTLQEKKLIGLSVRTSYEKELNPATAHITPCVTRFFKQNISQKIPHLINPHIKLCAYTDYENDYKGEYTYFIGQEVSSLKTVPEGLCAMIIPSQNYAKFTTDPDPIPHVIIKGWQKIWAMDAPNLGGQRTYKVDFEVYDERAQDPDHTILDIYVGIEK